MSIVLNEYEISFGVNSRIMRAETASKAKYDCYLSVSDVYGGDFQAFLRTIVSCRKIGIAPPVVEQPEPSADLPEGKTCADCAHWGRTCHWLLSREPTETTCDWAPSKFREVIKA